MYKSSIRRTLRILNILARKRCGNLEGLARSIYFQWRDDPRFSFDIPIRLPRYGPITVKVRKERKNWAGEFICDTDEIFIYIDKKSNYFDFVHTAIHELRHAQQVIALGMTEFTREMNRPTNDTKYDPLEIDAHAAEIVAGGDLPKNPIPPLETKWLYYKQAAAMAVQRIGSSPYE